MMIESLRFHAPPPMMARRGSVQGRVRDPSTASATSVTGGPGPAVPGLQRAGAAGAKAGEGLVGLAPG